MPHNNWDTPAVAKAMRAYIEATPAEWEGTLDPQRYFIEAMQYINPHQGFKLLDVGCGMGHYYEICRRFFPDVQYMGTDLPSQIAEAQALWPDGKFEVCDFYDNCFANYDAVHVASVIESTSSWCWPALHYLIKNAKLVIWNRIHLTDGSRSIPVFEPTYVGKHEWKMHWNLGEIITFVGQGRVLWQMVWSRGDMATLIIRGYDR